LLFSYLILLPIPATEETLRGVSELPFISSLCVYKSVLFFLPVLLVILGVVAGCTGSYPEVSEPPIQETAINETVVPIPGTSASYSYTHIRPDGNRLVSSHGSLPDSSYLDIKLTGIPVWVLGSILDDSMIWAAVLNDGTVEGFRIQNEEATPVTINPAQLPTGMPPVLRVRQSTAEIVMPPSASASQLTHPVILPGSGRMAFIDASGDVVIRDDVEIARFPVNALPDSRIILDDKDRFLVLSGATERYGHAVLGDGLEASNITLIDARDTPRVADTIDIAGEGVIEGIAPIWADITGDGSREIIVTLSNASNGARVVAFDEDGKRVAVGPAIGRGFRWRHQLAVGPFGPQGEVELVDVVTPHLGGIVSFYRFKDGELRVEAEVRGYSSHVMGSRNLDMAFAGDLDSDGKIELLIPNQNRTELGGIGRNSSGASVEWTIPIGGRLSTNLSAVALADGGLAVGIGRQDGVLRLWLP
jgi:hypothetical protein